MGYLRDRTWAVRASASVIALTLLLILSECTGGGSGAKVGGLASTVGTLCMTGDYSYQVDVSGSQPFQRDVEVNPFESAYQGSIGGQIRGLAKLNVSIPDVDISEILFWGAGASIKYGTPEHTLGTILLRKPGAVNDIAPIVYDDKYMLAYGTERGLGIAGPNSAGTAFVDYSTDGAWRSVPEGVTSVDFAQDSAAIVFTTADGFVQQITVAELVSQESCSGIVAAESLDDGGGSAYIPVRTQVGGEHVFVLSKPTSVAISTAPTYEQAYYPLFQAMIDDGTYSRVRAYSVSSGSPTELGFSARDDSFDRFDRFVPTDIAYDGQKLYVAGLVYDQQSVFDFLAQHCASATSQVKCMADAAKDGTLATFEGGTGIYRFLAGFFVYRDMDDLSKADYFKEIQITALRHQEDAPPFLFALAAQDDRVFIRGPNFLVSAARTEAVDDSEDWAVDMVADLDQDLVAGLPNRVISYLGGAASTFTALRAADGSGDSSLELMSSGGAFSVKDTGAIFVRVDGAGGSSNLVAAIEMEDGRGGRLYMENAVTRKLIDPELSEYYVSHAGFDGSTLAFAVSQTGPAAEYTYGWHVMVQESYKDSTRGDLFVARSGGAGGEFKDFPEVSSSDTDPSRKRGIGGVAVAGDAMAVMYAGYYNGKWYHQVVLYDLHKSGSTFDAPDFKGKTQTIITSAGSTAHAGKIIRMQISGSNYEVIFSTPKTIYKWIAPSGSMTSIYNSDELMDAALDADGGERIAVVSGFNVYVKKISSMTSQGPSVQLQPKSGTSMTSLVNARVALSGDVLALVTPYATEPTFSVYQVGSSSMTAVAATELSKFFDVKIFSSYPDYMLASSQASGIEIYSLSGD